MNQILYSLSMLEETYLFEIEKVVDGLEFRVFNNGVKVTGWLEDIHHPDDIAERINEVDDICGSIVDDMRLLGHLYWTSGYYYGVEDHR